MRGLGVQCAHASEDDDDAGWVRPVDTRGTPGQCWVSIEFSPMRLIATPMTVPWNAVSTPEMTEIGMN